MRYVGVDLAWGQRGTTGLALADGRGVLREAVRAGPDAEILAWLARATDGPCLVAIDAPIIVRNATGSRPCERLVGRYFGAYHASCHPASTSRPVFAAGTRAQKLAGALGLEVDPASTAPRRAVEVYPHPAIVALFGLGSIVRYKAKPGRDLASLRSETLRLLGLLESLRQHPVPLHPHGCADWRRIRAEVAGAVTKAALRRVEDVIDAVVCAYIAAFADARPDRVRVLGDVEHGYILTPVTGPIAARIDADARAAAWQEGEPG